jgi:hypothetical protein
LLLVLAGILEVFSDLLLEYLEFSGNCFESLEELVYT